MLSANYFVRRYNTTTINNKSLDNNLIPLNFPLHNKNINFYISYLKMCLQAQKKTMINHTAL